MPNKIMNDSLDEFFDKSGRWKTSLDKLRSLFLESGLHEDFKWGKACYTLGGKNIAVLQCFKNYCAVLFVKGSLMNDPHGVLFNISQNTQAARQLRFTADVQIIDRQDMIKDYIKDAVRIEKEGLEPEFKKTEDYPVPEELTAAFEQDSEFRDAFYKLTPGRQRGYLLQFAAAKQSATRSARIQKYRDKIFDGLGLNDR